MINIFQCCIIDVTTEEYIMIKHDEGFYGKGAGEVIYSEGGSMANGFTGV